MAQAANVDSILNAFAQDAQTRSAVANRWYQGNLARRQASQERAQGTGSILGTVAGAGAGAFMGAPIQGAMIGSTLGGEVGGASAGRPVNPQAVIQSGLQAYDLNNKMEAKSALNSSLNPPSAPNTPTDAGYGLGPNENPVGTKPGQASIFGIPLSQKDATMVKGMALDPSMAQGVGTALSLARLGSIGTAGGGLGTNYTMVNEDNRAKYGGAEPGTIVATTLGVDDKGVPHSKSELIDPSKVQTIKMRREDNGEPVDVAYRYNRVTGRNEALMSPQDLQMIRGGMAGVNQQLNPGQQPQQPAPQVQQQNIPQQPSPSILGSGTNQQQPSSFLAPQQQSSAVPQPGGGGSVFGGQQSNVDLSQAPASDNRAIAMVKTEAGKEISEASKPFLHMQDGMSEVMSGYKATQQSRDENSSAVGVNQITMLSGLDKMLAEAHKQSGDKEFESASAIASKAITKAKSKIASGEVLTSDQEQELLRSAGNLYSIQQRKQIEYEEGKARGMKSQKIMPDNIAEEVAFSTTVKPFSHSDAAKDFTGEPGSAANPIAFTKPPAKGTLHYGDVFTYGGQKYRVLQGGKAEVIE